MKPAKHALRLSRDTIRLLTPREFERPAGARRGEPVTPACPSEYTTCPNSCSESQ